MACSNAFTDSTIWLSVIFLNTTVFTCAPACSNAFVVSYSQLVPGNTGINTFGLAILFAAVYTFPASNTLSSSSFCSTSERVAKTLSKVPVQASNASFIAIFSLPITKFGCSVTSAILVYSVVMSSKRSAGTSAMIEPYSFAKRSSIVKPSSITAPRPLPNAILLTASHIPPNPIA